MAQQSQICAASIASATPCFYKWHSKFDGMDASLMARMKEPEDENWCLKKIYAQERLTVEIVVEALTKNGSAISAAGDGAMGRRPAHSHYRTVACQAISIIRLAIHYRARLDAETPLWLIGNNQRNWGFGLAVTFACLT